MAKFSRLEVVTKMMETGMVPLFYHSDVEVAKKTLKACYQGGARLLEFTSRGDFAYQIFDQLNKYVLAELPEMIMGCLLYTSPSPRDMRRSRMPSSA